MIPTWLLLWLIDWLIWVFTEDFGRQTAREIEKEQEKPRCQDGTVAPMKSCWWHHLQYHDDPQVPGSVCRYQDYVWRCGNNSNLLLVHATKPATKRPLLTTNCFPVGKCCLQSTCPICYWYAQVTTATATATNAFTPNNQGKMQLLFLLLFSSLLLSVAVGV